MLTLAAFKPAFAIAVASGASMPRPPVVVIDRTPAARRAAMISRKPGWR
jgi:hypothetical protein